MRNVPASFFLFSVFESVISANLNSGTDVALCEAQVVKDTDDVTNADFSREVCFCNNNFHIFATTESATLPVEQRTRAELLFYNAYVSDILQHSIEHS